jgi:hypothetical protein
MWGNITLGVGGIISKETLYRVQQGDFQRERKDEERAKGGGGTGGLGGGGRWERQRKLQYMRLIYYFQKESTRTVNLAQSKELRV